MPVLASHLLAQRELRLTAVTDPGGWAEVPISWSSTTELEDPVPFLRGGELVLTTGLRRRTRREWDQLVRDLVAVPVAALCIGIGLVHDRVPAGLRDAAERHGLALLTSPVEIPFIQISRWTADQIFAEQYARTRLMIRLQDEIMGALLAGRGLRHLVAVLAHHLTAEVAVLDTAGTVLEQHPSAARWPVEEVAAASNQPQAAATSGTVSLPVRADGVVVGYIAARGPSEQVTLLAPTANLVGLEIARRQALVSGGRELVAQVIADIVHHGLPEKEAQRKLAQLGLDPQGSHRVVVASSAHAASLLRQRPLDLVALLQGRSDLYPMCPLDDGIVVVVGADGDARTVADRLLRYLDGRPAAAKVGVSGLHRGSHGIRIGYHEARHAQGQGSGVQECRTLSLPGLILSSADLPLAELARSLLEPLRRYDADHGAALEATVRLYLEHDGSMAETCRAMNLHRNSLRYRIGQIERLLGKRLGSTQDRLELWLALQVLAPPDD
ncbi:PucR family transcriptional regulator [Streptomyces sp. NPDC058092]|uniref:PucR family transcriptional regulator n=1 Tax=Streptomyces sp. NPDC058092 TaxID=3346336 RepID=UPI0036EDBE44